jgi:sulfite reductase beta subunit-like hemoprotein
VRNITVCPCCKFNADAFDVEPLAEKVRAAVSNSGLLEKLGRKFKITFAGCSSPQTRPYINDISFIATSATTVRVVGAGSFGPSPESGIVLFDELSVHDVTAITIAAIEMFAEHGERENRRKARFRHIRQRMGDEAFLKLLNEYFNKRKDKLGNNELVLSKGLAGWNKVAAIQTVGGDIETKDALKLAELIEETGAEIRVNGYHGIDIFSKGEFKLPSQFDKYANLPRFVACPGSSSCPKGMVDCLEQVKLIADELRGNAAFYDKTIALSGCPNNCACSAVADIGLVGRVKDKKPAFKITFNDGNGNNSKLGSERGIVAAGEAGKWIRGNYTK